MWYDMSCVETPETKELFQITKRLAAETVDTVLYYLDSPIYSVK